ncbi:MAG: hypothetical protein WEG36_03525 [Gemmatimonadota bacterium]
MAEVIRILRGHANLYRTEPLQRIGQEELDGILLRTGAPGRTTRTIECVVRGSGPTTIEYSALNGGTVSATVVLP